MSDVKRTAELGDEVECMVTKFRGIVTSHAKHLTGCDRISIQPPVGKDGKMPDGMWIDRAAVKVLKKGKVKPDDLQEEVKKGGPATRVERRNQ